MVGGARQGACKAGGVHGRRDGHYSGRYASYWNAFLFFISLAMETITSYTAL